jgi:histidyl-tRNA synthetase
METLEIQRVRGTNDFVPPDDARLRRLTETLRATFSLYGYQGIETPIIENLDLFLRKSGEEIVARMYAFTHWNRQLCLRPELTASVMRAYVNHLQDRALPLRLAYAGPTFRYEKPQRGRYRQFTEVGVECIGGPGAAADAEVLRLATRGLAALGLGGGRLVIGHLGVVLELLAQLGIDEHGQALILSSMEALARRRVDRDGVVERIVGLVGGDLVSDDVELLADDSSTLPTLLREFGPRGAAQVTADLLQRANLSLEAGTRTPEEIVERLLAKASRADPSGHVRTAAAFIVRLSELAGPPKTALPALDALLREYALDPAPLREVASALELFAAHGGKVDELTIDLSLGRGLRYYTGLVFEIYHDAPGGSLQVCGGGRYDELVSSLGGREAVPAVGFSFGLERLNLVLGPEPVGRASEVDLLLAPLDLADLPQAAAQAERLRDVGIRVELDLRLRGVRANLRHADRGGTPLVALLGERERNDGVVVLRTMGERVEQTVALTDLPAVVLAALRNGNGVGLTDRPVAASAARGGAVDGEN